MGGACEGLDSGVCDFFRGTGEGISIWPKEYYIAIVFVMLLVLIAAIIFDYLTNRRK